MNNGKKVMLYSGGLDCTLQSFLIKPDILLHMDIGGFYSEAEKKHLTTRKHFCDEIIIDDTLRIGDFEMETLYLPYRNLYFILNALQIGEHIYFGFNESDVGPDKSQTFIDKATAVIKEMTKEAWITPEHTNFTINAPFMHLTKGEMVAKCLYEGMTPEFIQSIRSCYDDESEKGCGACSPCFSKLVALVVNDISIDGVFDVDPIPEFLKYVEERREEFKVKRAFKEFEKVYVILS